MALKDHWGLHAAYMSWGYHVLSQCPRPTCADEHDVIHGSVQGLGPVHNDLRVVHVAFDELGPAVHWGHGVVHQRVVFDKLQRLVWQVEGTGEVGHPRFLVDALPGRILSLCMHTRADSPAHVCTSWGSREEQNVGLHSGFLKKGENCGDLSPGAPRN